MARTLASTDHSRRNLWFRGGHGHSMSRAVSAMGEAHGGQAPARSSSLGVVITGGTRGFGYALAKELVAAGDRVVICGRDESRLTTAATALRQHAAEGGAVHAVLCDVSNGHDVAALGAFAAEKLGTVHLWFNNAGAITSKGLLDEVPTSEIVDAVGTNVLGSLLCCREAIKIMRRQPTYEKPQYHVFNFGFSSWGRQLSATACTHKSTKSALSSLTEALAADLAAAGVTSVGVHNLSPGMVLTDLLLKDTSAGSRRFFNALAEEPDTVAAALVPQLRSIQGTTGSVDYLSPLSAVAKVISRLPQIINGGRFFDRSGERVQQRGQKYAANGVREPYDQNHNHNNDNNAIVHH